MNRRPSLSIRSSLLLGFGAMATVMVLATGVAFYATTKVSDSVSDILDVRLPITVETLRVARATDALAATAPPLASVTQDSERVLAFDRVERALTSLEKALIGLAVAGAETRDIRRITDELAGNLRRLRELVGERIEVVRARADGRERLLLNRQAFQRELTHRARVLEGDADVARRMLEQVPVPVERVARLTTGMVALIPVARFYADIEALNGRLLAAGQEPTLTSLDISRGVISSMLGEIDRSHRTLDPALAKALASPLADLRAMATANQGLPALRERELRIVDESRNLIAENQEISHRVDTATQFLVRTGLSAINDASATANETRRRNMLVLLVVTIGALGGVGALMHLHVNRHVISRLTRLSEAMQGVAAGRHHDALPPEENDELGRLSAALHQFRDTAIESDRRETELRASNAKAEAALRALEAAQRDLVRQARTDFLTGIANRQHFMETAERIRARAARAGRRVSILMLDIDHFKSVNDTHGHLIGDQALRAVAETCQATLRPTDMLGRLGGEEFAALLPEATLSGALEAAERVRAAVNRLALLMDDGTTLKLSISVGAAEIALPDEPLDSALARADAALYAAKQAGRDQVRGDGAVEGGFPDAHDRVRV